MRIAYVITLARPLGGAQVHVRDLASELAEGGHEVHLIVGNEGEMTVHAAERGIVVHIEPALRRAIRPWDDLRAVAALRARLRSIEPDLVSTHSSKAGVIGRLAAASLGVPRLFTAHGWAFHPDVAFVPRTAYRAIEATMARITDRIVTVSRADAALSADFPGASRGRVVTIRNAMPDVAPNLRADPRRAPPKLIMVARFQAPKDHATLLRALAGLGDAAWTLEFVGDGPRLDAVKGLARELGLTDRARFVGARSDVAERLAASQAFVMLSTREGLPRSIIEAMRAGLPVVAADVGGCGELVDHGRSGMLVPATDVEATRAALRRLLHDPDLRRSMGDAGRERYEAGFTFGRLVDETLAVYEDVLDARSTARGRSA